MKKRVTVAEKQFKQIWDKYKDTLWKIEQAWGDPKIDPDKRTVLTESVMEMLKIEKKLKQVQDKYQKRVAE